VARSDSADPAPVRPLGRLGDPREVGRTRNCAAVPPAAPLPLEGIFTEMIEFNSGPIRCFA
jgi:hypothetical protein